jgi:glycosyltransferase involved in cell wall biosynthesis
VRVVVYPHVMELGGSQLNAIELAAAVRDLGHEVLVFGHPGPLLDRVADLDLEFVAAPPLGRRPSPAVMAGLTRLVRKRGVDVVHGYEWTTALEAYLGPRARLGTAAVATVMSMAVAPFLPYDLPLVVGTEQIAAHERDRGRGNVSVIEPPVDTRHNGPAATGDLDGFRRRHGLSDGVPTVVCVTRLAAELKLEGLLTGIDVVGELARHTPVRLLVVGDGPAREAVGHRAAAANSRAGRDVVVLTGELRDPRPAYAVADVCWGMGGSALRAMAFAKPLVVQGERGFWELATPETVERFLWTGWYGMGEDAAAGAPRLTAILAGLLADPVRQAELGAYGRSLVEDRFSLAAAGPRQVEVYRRAIDTVPRHGRDWVVPGGVAAARFLRYKADRKLGRALRRGSRDDFNSRPVAALSAASASARPVPEDGGPVVSGR